jgi:hypothetical protein
MQNGLPSKCISSCTLEASIHPIGSAHTQSEARLGTLASTSPSRQTLLGLDWLNFFLADV